MSTTIHSPILDYNAIKQTIESSIKSPITPNNVLNLITNSMQIVEQFANNIKGQDKKQICMGVIYDIINGLSDHNSIVDKQFILNLLDNIFDPFIENIIAVSKGEISINKDFIITTPHRKINLFSCCKKQK